MKRIPLQHNIQVHEWPRPIKVAYIIPAKENKTTHEILDGIFLESYTRWAGIWTLVIPSQPEKFTDPRYIGWLKEFDPDLIYTYVPLSKKLVEEINHRCLPTIIIKHASSKCYIPRHSMFFKPLKSLSTLYSAFRTMPGQTIPKVITQIQDNDYCRFLSDNFGYRHALETITYQSRAYKTLCYDKYIERDKRISVGSEKTHELNDIVDEIASRKALTFSQLSFLATDSQEKPYDVYWCGQFHIFVGSTYQDRVDFWNIRHFTPSYCTHPNSLILQESDFDNDEFIKEIGIFLNANAFSSISGRASIHLKSRSLDKGRLSNAKEKLWGNTHAHLTIPQNYDEMVLPNEKQSNLFSSVNNYINAHSFKINEAHNNGLIAHAPQHFNHIPVEFRENLSDGVWAIDLEIERHNNLSPYDNVTEVWKLPRRLRASRAFTNKLSKVSKRNLLTLIPTPKGNNVFARGEPLEFDLFLPTDENFFRCLLTNNQVDNEQDLRTGIILNQLNGIQISDKGQGFNGVIAMFDNLNQAYRYLGNTFWMNQVRKRVGIDLNEIRELVKEEKSDKDLMRELIKLADDMPLLQLKNLTSTNEVTTEHIKQIERYCHMDGRGRKIWKALIEDSLELLTNKNVFFMVYDWRCSYCGHANILPVDTVKKQNECAICHRIHFLPIDPKFKFMLNNFVHKVLVTHSGYPVLWALGFLQQARSITNNNFYYIPEVNLFYNRNQSTGIRTPNNEIDFLAVHGGKFHAGEVKTSVQGFMKSDNFIHVMCQLQPDVACLIFEKYVDSPEQDRSFALKNFTEDEFVQLKKCFEVPSSILSEAQKKLFSKFKENYKELEFTNEEVDSMRTCLIENDQSALSAKLLEESIYKDKLRDLTIELKEKLPKYCQLLVIVASDPDFCGNQAINYPDPYGLYDYQPRVDKLRPSFDSDFT